MSVEQQEVEAVAWDFVERYPDPLDEAINAGVFGDLDIDGEAVVAIHEEVGREVLAMLAAFDEMVKLMRHGLDPKTGKLPKTEERRAEIERLLSTLGQARKRALEEALAAYMNGFGLEAARAFGHHLYARHLRCVIYRGTGEKSVGGLVGWKPGMGIWNEAQVGPFSLDKTEAIAGFYEPGHAFHYHFGGVPESVEAIVRVAPALSREGLCRGGRERGQERASHGFDIAWLRVELGRAKEELAEVSKCYQRLFEDGPISLVPGVSADAPTCVPVNLVGVPVEAVRRWAVGMAAAHQFVSHAAARVKGLERELNQFPGGVERLGGPVEVVTQLSLFG
jgi:hypothetical protein